MIPTLLGWLPAWMSGRVEPQAQRDLKRWTKNNATVRALSYGWIQRLLFTGTDHPVLFSFLIGTISALVGWFVTTGWDCGLIHLPKLAVQNDLDLTAFTAAPWGVQATLAALVYPIVFSFIALMLQRRAHSSVALRVYVLESGIAPAGASAIGLLLAIGVQFFLVPYVPNPDGHPNSPVYGHLKLPHLN